MASEHASYFVGCLKPNGLWWQPRCVCGWRGAEYDTEEEANAQACIHAEPMVKERDRQPAPHEIDDANVTRMEPRAPTARDA